MRLGQSDLLSGCRCLNLSVGDSHEPGKSHESGGQQPQPNYDYWGY
jgi:hypothetical protein